MISISEERPLSVSAEVATPRFSSSSDWMNSFPIRLRGGRSGEMSLIATIIISGQILEACDGALRESNV
jgi:hypothetical protein